MRYSATSNQPHHSTNKRLFSAAIIDEHGKEVPITEAMIQQACDIMEQQWHFPSSHSKPSPTMA